MNIVRVLTSAIAALLILSGAGAAVAGGNADLAKARVYVGFKAGQKGLVERALHNIDADFHYSFDELNAFVVSVPPLALAGLSRNPNIEYIEKDAKRYPLGEVEPWGISKVQADQVDSRNVNLERLKKVCIIDSGYSLGHEDLPANISVSNDAASGDVFNDSCGHGTHVAGTIAALADNGVGVIGVLPNEMINLHIVKVFGDNSTPGSGSCSWTYSSTLVSALSECESAGTDVVSMSLGGPLKSRAEDKAFGNFYNAGKLSVAAAGNDGNTRKSYPASYDSVISVAAVDSNNVVADFSQQNSQVELAAPGVAVKSTVPMGSGLEESLTVAGSTFEATAMEGSFKGSGSGPLFQCAGVGDTGACSGATDKVCLIERGDITFAAKVTECEAQGGVAAIIFNNNSGPLFTGTLGGAATGIPSVAVSGDTGAELQAKAGNTATVGVNPGNYAFYDGTSMATPHVSGVAALVWSNKPDCSNQEIRDALTQSTMDLGAAGRDDAYGFGLVQAQAADDYLAVNGCGAANNDGGGDSGGNACPIDGLLAAGESCSVDSECCSNSCKGKPGSKTCK